MRRLKTPEGTSWNRRRQFRHRKIDYNNYLDENYNEKNQDDPCGRRHYDAGSLPCGSRSINRSSLHSLADCRAGQGIARRENRDDGLRRLPDHSGREAERHPRLVRA